jgi:protein phosphatase
MRTTAARPRRLVERSAPANDLTHAGLSDRGERRSANQDRWAVDPALGLYMVADGMGGTPRGGLAAQIVIEMLPYFLRKHLRGVHDLADPRALIRTRAALVELNRRVRLESQQHPSLTGMGSTVVCALVWEDQAVIAHLGDSRAYLFRDGELELLTRDHSRAQERVDRGEPPSTVPATPPLGRLTRFIGMASEVSPDARLQTLRPDDCLLLCSNGLWEMLSPEEIRGILQLDLPPQEICRLLVDAANLAGGLDNIAILLLR